MTGTGNQRWVKGARGGWPGQTEGEEADKERDGGGRPVVNGRSTERSSSGLMKPDHRRSVSQPAETRSNSIVMKRASAAAGRGLRQTHLLHYPLKPAANKEQGEGPTFRSNSSFMILFDRRNKAARAGPGCIAGLLETQKVADRKPCNTAAVCHNSSSNSSEKETFEPLERTI